MLDTLFVDNASETGNLLCDLWKLLLNQLWHLGSWNLQKSKQAEHDASDLELELELFHELQPLRKHEECLALVLDD